MRYTNELYDHEDKVYSAAFASEMPELFLFAPIRRYRKFWLALGLRGGQGKCIDEGEYLRCLLSLEGRIKRLEDPKTRPPALLRDIEAVLEGFERVQFGMASKVRDTISSLAVVPTKVDMAQEPAFRRPLMQRLCDAKPFIGLSEVVHLENAPYTWTQVPFPLQRLPSSAFHALELKGSPTVNMVWNHLKALVDISAILQDADVNIFLDDLSRTYRYLQDHTVEPAADIDLARLWLNMDIQNSEVPTAQEINCSWMDICHLVLFCPYDPGEMRSVRSFLMPYEALLKRCGCHPIRNPTWKMSEKQTSGPTMSEINRLWKDSQLTDVAFKAEGEIIAAHKLVLAAASKYCEVQFTGPWSKFSDNEGPIELENIKYSTLLQMIQFAYHDDLDWAAMEADAGNVEDIADKLDALLDLLAGADRWVMSRLHSKVETYVLDHARTLVRIDNVGDVEKIARDVQAKDLAGFCAKYREENKEILTVVEGEID
jgi:hypothetical protein